MSLPATPSNPVTPDAASSVLSLRGVGPGIAEKLGRLGIASIQDLLFHLPLRYQDRTRIAAIGSLRPGDEISVRGEVQLTEIKHGRRRMLLSRISDGTGFLTLRFFHFNARQQAGLVRGARIHCFGEVRAGNGGLEMAHPDYRNIDDDDNAADETHLTPVYPVTEGLRQLKLRGLMDIVLADDALLNAQLADWLPSRCLPSEKFPGLVDAVRYVHHPPPDAPVQVLQEGLHPSQQRLAFEELLAQQLSLRQLRAKHQHHVAPPLGGARTLSQRLLSSLPFELTRAQRRVADTIFADLDQTIPMQRLVQGDVGCGKTIVAALAACHAVEAGYQVAVMAPTELLADQHRLNFAQWLEPLDVTVTWLTGKIKGRKRSDTLSAIVAGDAGVVVGTQALFQEDVVFHRLGLVVIDEQHRFGVHQRMALREKGARGPAKQRQHPHQLVMTATPIPRTLAQTAYADLDVSVIDELPPGRTPVGTVVVSEQRRDEVVARMHQACREGRQAYWVCPLVEESESLQCQAAQETAEQLQQALPDLRVGLVHGRLKSAQKEVEMQQFKAGEMDVLVATTVIEVGVDVPNATLMIIDNAERLGLSQLHQLRGRVGRGVSKSSCVLIYGAQLSKLARERLAILRETNDGFVVAQRDLELRGPGELLGTRQTGLVNLRIADFQRDQHLVPAVAECAEYLLREQPRSVGPLIRRWLGEGLQYSNV
ncbi:MAG: ATP-dependent DNA helicase RecG [Gammaproteobacteria bacterium]|nr:ATP-dependent DNA helicase RecG [Gammaproteobacteria bacterium]